MDRGQAYTLEALISIVVLLTAVVFALNAVVITPTSVGTADQGGQAELRGEVASVLAEADRNGELTALIAYSNESSEAFAGDWNPEVGYRSWPADSSFTSLQTIDQLVADQQLRYNVEAVWVTENGTRESHRLRHVGSPGDEAAVVTRTVVLTDDVLLTGPASNRTTIGEGAHLVSNQDPETDFYNTVELRVIVW